MAKCWKKSQSMVFMGLKDNFNLKVLIFGICKENRVMCSQVTAEPDKPQFVT